jgi:hypothetical protein
MSFGEAQGSLRIARAAGWEMTDRGSRAQALDRAFDVHLIEPSEGCVRFAAARPDSSSQSHPRRLARQTGPDRRHVSSAADLSPSEK